MLSTRGIGPSANNRGLLLCVLWAPVSRRKCICPPCRPPDSDLKGDANKRRALFLEDFPINSSTLGSPCVWLIILLRRAVLRRATSLSRRYGSSHRVYCSLLIVSIDVCGFLSFRDIRTELYASTLWICETVKIENDNFSKEWWHCYIGINILRWQVATQVGDLSRNIQK